MHCKAKNFLLIIRLAEIKIQNNISIEQHREMNSENPAKKAAYLKTQKPKKNKHYFLKRISKEKEKENMQYKGSKKYQYIVFYKKQKQNDDKT